MACKKMSNRLVKGKYEQICIYQSAKSTWHGCFDGLFMLNMRNRLKYVHLSGIIINMVNCAIKMENIIFFTN